MYKDIEGNFPYKTEKLKSNAEKNFLYHFKCVDTSIFF